MFWNRHENLKTAIFIGMAIFLIWFISQIQSVALLAFASFVLACSLTPAVDKLSSFKHISRGLASTIVIITTLLVILLFFVPIISMSIQEINQFISNIPALVDKSVEFLSSKTLMGKSLMEYIDLGSITSASSQVASGLVNKSINITVAFMEAMTVIITMGVIVFYLIYEKNLLRDALIAIFPHKMKQRAKEVYESIEKKVGGYVIAQILSMTTIAILTAIGLMLLDVQYSVLLGLIAGLLDIIPIVGPTIALVLGVLCALQQGWVVVLLVVAVYLLAQWISNNFVRPYVFGKFLDLHPVIIIFAFLIAAQFLGVWGVILSPAIAALLLTLFDELYLKTINNKTKEEEK
ncbi:AI-2E family transporter [bacterium]|nr:AI-2E family transporter [bacterium]